MFCFDDDRLVFTMCFARDQREVVIINLCCVRNERFSFSSACFLLRRRRFVFFLKTDRFLFLSSDDRNQMDLTRSMCVRYMTCNY
jgi:hypothetical protein